MNILCVGDVVGSAGCAHLRRLLPVVKRQYAVDLCIVNGENAADGNGIARRRRAHPRQRRRRDYGRQPHLPAPGIL